MRAGEGAVVLVYTADASRNGTYCAAACLGCTRRAADKDHRVVVSEEGASTLVNDHAGTCRALPRGVPARPDDLQGAEIIRHRRACPPVPATPRVSPEADAGLAVNSPA